MSNNKQYIALGAIVGFILCLFTMQTIHNFNTNDDKMKKIKMEQKKNLAFEKYFSAVIPDEWGGGKTDPYEYSYKDGKPVEQEHKEENKEEQNEQNENKPKKNDYEKHYNITREQLGQSGWLVLHMISSTYPVDVTPEFVEKTNLFLNLFGQFYPCKECSQHFLEMTSKKQFHGKGREDFMQYMCELHNIVNVRLGKEEVKCTQENLEKLWGGSCGCKSGEPPKEGEKEDQK